MAPNTERERTTSDGVSSTDAKEIGVRKAYSAPRLERYGDLRAITNMIGNMGADDGGTGGAMRTGV